MERQCPYLGITLLVEAAYASANTENKACHDPLCLDAWMIITSKRMHVAVPLLHHRF